MPEYQKRPDFVVVVDIKAEEKGKTIRIDSPKDLETYLYKFSNTELAECIWESLLYSYKSGVKSGLKKAGAPVAA